MVAGIVHAVPHNEIGYGSERSMVRLQHRAFALLVDSHRSDHGGGTTLEQ